MSVGGSVQCPRYGFLVRQHLEDGFWKGEVDSVLILVGHQPGLSDADCSRFPYVVLNETVTRAQAMAAGERSVMVKKVLEVWSEGDNLEVIKDGFFKCNLKPFAHPSYVGRKNHGFPAEQLVELCKGLPDHVSEEGRVTVHVFAPGTTPWYAYATRVIGSGCYDLMHKYALTERKFLGPTTLTPELAFIMANLALADRSKLVFDPYIGTGGALVGVAHHGAKMIGFDIDWRIIFEGQPYLTFDQYGLPRPEFLRADFSPEGRCLRELDICRNLFDAIVGDPPYGIRAGARKTGHKEEGAAPILPHHRESHVPQTRKYDGEEVIKDLMDAAAILLKPKGRLVYLHPIQSAVWKKDREAAMPSHPALRLLYCAEQPMRCGMSRILVTMEKRADAALSEEAPSKKLKSLE